MRWAHWRAIRRQLPPCERFIGPPPIVQPGHTAHALWAIFGARLIYCGPSPRKNDAAYAACFLKLARCAYVYTAPGYKHCPRLAPSRRWGRITLGGCRAGLFTWRTIGGNSWLCMACANQPSIVQPGHVVRALPAIIGARLIYCRRPACLANLIP